MMHGALEDISKAVGNTPIVRLNRVTGGRAGRDLRQVRVPEPGRQPQGPPRGEHAPPRRGGRAQAGRHDRRGDERQHRRVARAARRAARLQVRLRHARQDEPGEDQRTCARSARGSSSARPPSSRTIRAATTRSRSASRARRRTASTRTSTTTPPTPRRTTSRAGPEIWKQTGGDFDVFCAGMGTGGTLSGTRQVPARRRSPSIQIVGVDPVGSLYYDFVKQGRITKPFSYKVEGIGEDFFPTTMNLKILDDIVRVDDKECFLMTRDLTRLEGLFVGGSGGAAVAGAVKYARTMVERGEAHGGRPPGAHPRLPRRRRAQVRVEDLQRRLDARERLPRGLAGHRHGARHPARGKRAASSRRTPEATAARRHRPDEDARHQPAARSSRGASCAASSPRSTCCARSSPAARRSTRPSPRSSRTTTRR